MKTLDDEYEKNIGQFHYSGSALDDIDSAKGFADLARRWAIEENDTPVDGAEYSSKHYANDSKVDAEISKEAAVISVDASNSAQGSAGEAKSSEDNAKVSEDNAKQSEDNIYALVEGIDETVEAAIESVVSEGNTQVARVEGQGDTQVNRVAIEGRDQTQAVVVTGDQQVTRIVNEGNTQASRLDTHTAGLSDSLTAEANTHIERIEDTGEAAEQDLIRIGEIQVTRVRNEGDVQADRAEKEADRAEAAAIDLDNAPRYHGYFSPEIGYPPPIEQRIPYQWFCTESGSAGGIDWSEGDMLYYAPHPTNPDGEMGQYFRVAGELAGGGDPQPIEIPDDLIMQVGKRIFFRDSVGRLVQALSLDGNHDLLVGEMTPDLELDVSKAVNSLGLAASEIYHVEEQDSAGQPTVYHVLLSEKNGVTSITFNAHVNNQNNPHGVDYTQTGAAAEQHQHDWDDLTNPPEQATRWPEASEVAEGQFGNVTVQEPTLPSHPTTRSWVEQAIEDATDGEINASILGSIQQYPPTVSTAPIGLVWAQGQLLSRDAYPELFAWANEHDQVVTEAEWQGLLASSPSDTVAIYSSGTDSTNFRVPVLHNFAAGISPSSSGELRQGFDSRVGEHGHNASQPQHNHTTPNHTHPDTTVTTGDNSVSHEHSISIHDNNPGGSTYGILNGEHRGAYVDVLPTSGATANHTHNLSVDTPSGGAGDTGNAAPTITVSVHDEGLNTRPQGFNVKLAIVARQIASYKTGGTSNHSWSNDVLGKIADAIDSGDTALLRTALINLNDE